MPPEVKRTDSANVETFVQTLETTFRQFFELPPIPEFQQRLIYVTVMHDALFENHMAANENLSPEIIQEAKLAILSYLANFIPPVLVRKTQQD